MKRYDKEQKQWVNINSASNTPISDLSDSFESDNVEGALQEVAAKNIEFSSKIEEYDTTIEGMQEEIAWLKKYGGGGSGGGVAANAYISSTMSENLMIPTGENFNLPLEFSSSNIGSGTLKIFNNDSEIYSEKIKQGETTIKITSDKFVKGNNKIVVYAIDRIGTMSNTLTFYIRYGGLELTTTFDSNIGYDVGSNIRFYYIPTSIDTSASLTFYIEIDGVQSTMSCTSDVRASFTFPSSLEAGRHDCTAWIEDGKNMSAKLKFSLILLNYTNIVISSSTKSVIVEEGQQFTLDYKVFKKNDTSFKTKTYIDNNLVDSGTCTLDTQYYTNSKLKEGTHTVKIEVFDLTETVSDYFIWNITVTESTYEMIRPTISGATFIGTAQDRTNADSNKNTWQGEDQDGNKIDAILNNFTFNSENGWIKDALVISGDSSVEIPISPLANNARYGLTVDIEFMTKQIGVENAEVLSIWDNTKNCGIKITTEEAIIKSTENEKRLYFSEEQFVSIMFVIDRDEKTAKILLNGVVCGGFALKDYTAEGQLYQEDFGTNATIWLGGKDINGYCEIKNIRIYQIALGTNELMNNYLCNFTDKSVQKNKVDFQKGDTLPTLTVYGDFSGLGKNDKKPCDIIYQSTDITKYGESFRLEGKYSQLQYQGTSSMQYPIKNYRLNPRDAKGKVKLDPFNNGVKETRFTLKADYASSGHWQNTGLAKWVNDHLYHYNVNDEKSMNPKKWFDIQNGKKLTDTREAINGFPCRLILINDGSTTLNEGQYEPTPGNTKDMGVFNFNNDKSNTKTLGFDTDNFPFCASFEVASNSDTSAGAFMSYKGEGGSEEELAYIKESFELRFPDEDDVGIDYGFLDMNGDTTKGLKRVIDFVDKSSDEDFIAHFEEYFNKQYTFRYFLLVMGLGMVDNLGKNMMLDTWDGQIFYPRFYDMDTICSFNNSGVITFDTDIEMEQGYWNTSSSRLWTRVRDLFHNELVVIYKDMRQNGFDYNTLMNYFYDDQIAKIPESYYNKDYDVKYGPYATEYMGIANGNAYEHLKRWLKRRLLFTDSLYDYAPSYADSLTIRANTTEPMTIEIETYAPVYQHMSWYNNQMDKKKIDGKTAVTFTGTAQAATDQEVIIYGGSNIKRIRGISTMNPNSMLIGNATKLVELECNNAPLLTDINSNKANLSPNVYLTRVDISNCPQLGGTLRLNNSPLLQEVNAQGTAITAMLLPTSIKNLQTLKVPKGVTELTLSDAKTLTTLNLEEGYLLETLTLSNCNKLKSFDLSKVKNITLDNSYVAEEVRLSTNQQVNLKNMEMLKRLTFTPNRESEEFDLTRLKNSPDVTVTSFNCPNFKEFITTAPQRVSYGKSNNNIYPYKLFMANKLDLRGTQIDTVKFLCTTDIFDLKLPNTVKNFYCDSAFDLDTSVLTDGDYDVVHGELIKPYTTDYTNNVYRYEERYIEGYSIPQSNWQEGYQLNNGQVAPQSVSRVTDFFSVSPNTSFSASSTGAPLNSVPYTCISFYDENKNHIENGVLYRPIAVPLNGRYARISLSTNIAINQFTINYTGMIPRTPNIIPTSANGSLLFNINQNEPQQNAPYIWDLQGMKLNDFHTYGVNNKINTNLKVVVDKRIKRINDILYWYQGTNQFCCYQGANDNTKVALTPFKLPLNAGTVKITTNVESSMNNHIVSESVDGYAVRVAGTSPLTATCTDGIDYYLALCTAVVDGLEWIQVEFLNVIYRFYFNDFDVISSDTSGTELRTTYLTNLNELGTTVKGNDYGNLTMPKRLADYKVQIKNADITPNQYNTMLYPKLVDTTLPITGKIDYSKYKGKYLSWAFAYTTDAVVRTPLDSRKQSQIINDYNKLYGTDFIDIVDVWAYKNDDFSNRATNNNITKAYIELTQDNYKTRIDEVLQWYPNCTELYLFEDGSVTSLENMFNTNNANCRDRIIKIEFINEYFTNLTNFNNALRLMSNLIEVKDLPNSITDMNGTFYNDKKFTTISNIPSSVKILMGCFGNCTSLVEIPDLPNTITDMWGAFEGSGFNQQIDLSHLTNLGVSRLGNTWSNCKSLSYTPILPSNYTGTLQLAFQNTKITTAPVLPNGVNNLNNTFNNCKELTTVGNIPTSCANYNNAFRGCSKLVSVPQTGWNGDLSNTFYECSSLNQLIEIESATGLQYTFAGARSLAITPNLPSIVNGISMTQFAKDTSLVTPPITPEGVTKMDNCYNGCTSLTSAPNIPDTVSSIVSLVYNCNKLTEITIPLENITSYTNALYGTGIQKINWVGKRKTNFDIISNGLYGGYIGTMEYEQETLKSLVPEHLDDLYKDKVKINFGDNKITVNGTEKIITT